MKNSLPLVGIVLLLVGVWYFLMSNRPTPTVDSKKEKMIKPTTAQFTEPLVLGSFKGTLPCADCSGLETELTLTRSATGSAEGMYVMTENYIGKSVKPIETKGEWTTLRGTKKDENAVVYQLDPDKPEESQYYLKVNDSQIKILDKNENDIEGPFNYTLTK